MGEDLCSSVKNKLGFQPTLINPRYVSGIDEALLDELQKDHTVVITLEDSILDGGYGQKIASYYGASDMKVLNYGLRKEYLDGYNVTSVLNEYGITIDNIVSQIMQFQNY